MCVGCDGSYLLLFRGIIGIRDALTRLYDDSTSTHKVEDVLAAMNNTISTLVSTVGKN